MIQGQYVERSGRQRRPRTPALVVPLPVGRRRDVARVDVCGALAPLVDRRRLAGWRERVGDRRRGHLRERCRSAHHAVRADPRLSAAGARQLQPADDLLREAAAHFRRFSTLSCAVVSFAFADSNRAHTSTVRIHYVQKEPQRPPLRPRLRRRRRARSRAAATRRLWIS